MFTSKNAASRTIRCQHIAGGLFLLTMPLLAAASCSAVNGRDTNGENESVAARNAAADEEALDSVQPYPSKPVCGEAAPGFMHCHAYVRTESDGTTVQPFAAPGGFGPPDLQSAYNIPSGGGTGLTVALIDAQDDPNAESDLAVYRSQFGLPPCTTANGCFTKVNENGQASPLPTGDSGWGGEISLDLDMVSAACPNCKILLVEASSASNDDLGTAVNTAASMGAAAISNSYGGSEDSTVTTTDTQYYNHPGIIITASSGDGGYGVEYPASGEYVLGVGGTTLAKSSSTRGWAEGAWNSGGSGCSAYVAKPSFQKDTGCAKRTVADVSAVADPNTGVAVYDTYGGASAGASGWEVYGGTSAASPLVAAILVATGHGTMTNGFPYANTGDFYDVTTGSNGSCGGSYLCTAGVGYDGPTGWGTPNGEALLGGGSSSSGSGAATSSSGSGTSTGSGGTGGAGSGSATSSGSGSGSTSASSTTSSGSGGGNGTCSHAICSIGKKLKDGCDSCVTKICKKDDYCCATKWDDVCVSEVSSICDDSCN
jgi:subtilase family serine protease